MQWSSGGLVWGLNFADAENAAYFCKRIGQVIALLIAAEEAAALEPEAESEPEPEPTPTPEPIVEQVTPEPAIVPIPVSAVPPVEAKVGTRTSSSSSPALGRKGSSSDQPLGKGVMGIKRSSVIVAGGRSSRSGSDSDSLANSPPPASQRSADGAMSGPDVSRIAEETFGNSPSMKARNRFSTSSTAGSRGSLGRKGTLDARSLSQSGSAVGSPTTLRAFKKKGGNWKDSVDNGTPRSNIMLGIITGPPLETSLFQKVAALSTRERVIKELFTTELSYTKSLQQVVKICIPMASHQKIFKSEIQAQIFGNIDYIYAVNTSLLGKLNTALSVWDDGSSTVGDILLNSIKSFRPYGVYLSEYSTGLKLLEELEQKKKPVATYCASCQEECGVTNY